jgi:hypothetical protein
MRRFALLLGTLVAVGCSSAANRKLDEIADRACACKDAECARKIGDEFVAWGKEYRGAKGDQAQADKAFERIVGCLVKVGGEKMFQKLIDRDKPEKGGARPDDKDADRPADKADKPDKPADRATDKPADKTDDK